MTSTQRLIYNIRINPSSSKTNIWGQSKNTIGLSGGTGLLLSIFTLTPDIMEWLICRTTPKSLTTCRKEIND